VYNERDFVQRLGGSVVGFGGRRVDGAINITVDRHVSRGLWNNFFGFSAHSDMHNNLNVWDDYILKYLHRALICSD